jgi:thymidylate synthase ThyX
MNDLIRARLVWDGGDEVHIPPEMGTPKHDQMQGTAAERLCELAGRACYDSLGIGRPSFTQDVVFGADPHTGEQQLKTIQGYHDHILEVGHGSVLEHFNFTIAVHGIDYHIGALLCVSRPGVTFQSGGGGPATFRLTINLRSAREWGDFDGVFGPLDDEFIIESANDLRRILAQAGNLAAPHIIAAPGEARGGARYAFEIVEPVTDNECWISMFVSGSRGLSHELVRHGDFTAISQRSTRFVDESESDWVEHPLTSQYMLEHGYGDPPGRYFEQLAVREAKSAYQQTVATLEPWLISRGIDKTSARKQARGAARGYLGNALYTELIFSANVAQWKRMLRQRASRFADAEIRELFCKVLGELKQSRYGDRFLNFTLAPSPDGIGQVANES